MENRPLTSIRGIAAVWVVAHHATGSSSSDVPFLRLGYTAVDLFFILSGVILSSVYHNMQLGRSDKFWIKRACRVYPAHIVALLILTLIVMLPAGVGSLASAMLNAQYLASVLLLQPYIQLDGLGNPVAWSAGVELGCYLLFPIAIMCVRSVRPVGLASVCLLAALVAVEWEVAWHFAGGTHGIPAVMRGLAGFALGMMIWRVSSGLSINAAVASAIELLALLGVFYATSADRPDLLPVWFAVLLFGLTFDVGLFARMLRVRWLVWLGNVSFSIYLLHYPVLLVVEKFLPRVPGFTIEEPIRLLALAVLTLGLSDISYRLIERPGRRIPALFGARRAAILPSPTRAVSADPAA